MRIAVLGGGGISGLTFAYSFLHEARRRGLASTSHGLPLHVTLFDASPCGALGGWIRSTSVPLPPPPPSSSSSSSPSSFVLFERGPRGFRPSGRGRETLALAYALGIERDVRGAAPEAKQRWIRLDARNQRVSPAWIVREGGWDLATEMFRRGRCEEESEDESVDSFVRRRFGVRVLDALVDPLVSGIYAADPASLSVRACIPRLAYLESRYGSVVLGAVVSSLLGRRIPSFDAFSTTGMSSLWSDVRVEDVFDASVLEAPLCSFVHGMQQLPDALERSLVAMGELYCSMKTSSVVRSIRAWDSSSNRRPGKAVVEWTDAEGLDGEKNNVCSESFDLVISTLPSPALTEILQRSEFQGAEKLAQITSSVPYSSLAVVSLYFEREDVLPVRSFGYLIPSIENEDILGVVFDSHTFPSQSSAPGTRLTVMMGGQRRPDLLEKSDNELISIARSALFRHWGVEDAPSIALAHRAWNCIPQYAVGHQTQVVDALANELQSCDIPLHIIGSSFHGVSINDCVGNARAYASLLLDQLTTPYHAPPS